MTFAVGLVCFMAGAVVSYIYHSKEQRILSAAESTAKELAHKAELEKERIAGDLKSAQAMVETKVKAAEAAVKSAVLQAAHDARTAGKDVEAFFSHILKAIGLLR